jgi:hypothetical protein
VKFKIGIAAFLILLVGVLTALPQTLTFCALSTVCTWTGAQTFSALTTHNGGLTSAGPSTFSGNTIAATLGPTALEQHTIPNVASDTFALLAAVQTLTNKTFTSPVITIGTFNGNVTGTSLQGTDSKFLSAGIVSASMGVVFCTDGNGGATTSGCASNAFPNVVYSTPTTAGNTSIGATTILTPSATATYRFNVYGDLTTVGTGCSGSPSNPTVSFQLIYTDPNSAGSSTDTMVIFVISSNTGNGTLGNNTGTSAGVPTFRAKTGTNIQISTTYTNGSACSIQPTVQFFPVLEQMTSS